MREQNARFQAVALRPRAILAVGITGHRGIGIEGGAADTIAAALEAVFRRLSRALGSAAAADASFFSSEPPMMRAICMAADGADLLGAVAARNCGAEIAAILPFSINEYRADFESTASAKLFDNILAGAVTRFELPGTRDEGARAYERANQVILANIDILVAVWDGQRANGRAGTGDVVPDASTRSIPTIVIDPSFPDTPKLVVPRSIDALDNVFTSDLNWCELEEDLAPLVANKLGPPVGRAKRQGLVDLFAETPRSANWRIEHPALLKVFGAVKARPQTTALRSDPIHSRWHAAVQSVEALDRNLASNLDELGEITRRIDKFAEYYGQLFRSSAASRFILIVAVAFLSGLIGILFPSLFGTSIILQLAVSVLVLIDSRIGSRHRWQERWLDYRLLAERLRSLRFLHPLGIGPDVSLSTSHRSREAWTDWYARRAARELGAPAGVMSAPNVAAMADQLVEVEIREQINYHRRAFRQLGTLERRLGFAASVALYLMIAIGLAMGVMSRVLDGLDTSWWKPSVNVLLGALPAAMTAFNGLRADGDLVRLVERSAMTAAVLGRLSRVTLRAPMTYDRLAGAAAQVAAIMANERSEWRFVLESRRTRTKRRQAMRRHLLVKLRRARKAS